MSNPLQVGDIVHGFAFGIFGRDSYSCRRVEAVGSDWAVTRTVSGFSPDKGTVELVAGSPDLVFAAEARDERQYCATNGCGEDEDE